MFHSRGNYECICVGNSMLRFNMRSGKNTFFGGIDQTDRQTGYIFQACVGFFFSYFTGYNVVNFTETDY